MGGTGVKASVGKKNLSAQAWREHSRSMQWAAMVPVSSRKLRAQNALTWRNGSRDTEGRQYLLETSGKELSGLPWTQL